MPEERYITIVSEKENDRFKSEYDLICSDEWKIRKYPCAGRSGVSDDDDSWEIEEKIGDGFLRVHRGCLVAVMAIHNVTDTINLSNGESLGYTPVRKGDHENTPECPAGRDPGISESWSTDDGR